MCGRVIKCTSPAEELLFTYASHFKATIPKILVNMYLMKMTNISHMPFEH